MWLQRLQTSMKDAGRCTNNQTYISGSRRSIEGTRPMIQKIKTMTNMTDSLLVPFLNWFHSNSPFSNFLSLLVFVCLKIWWWLVSAHNGFLFLCFYYNSPEVAFLTLLTHRPFICSTCGHQPTQQSSPVEQSFSSEQSFFSGRVGFFAEQGWALGRSALFLSP